MAEKPTPSSNTPQKDAQAIPADVQALIDGIKASNGGSANARSGTDVSTRKTKLTPASARAIMQAAAEAAGYTGTFSNADVTQFINQFDAEQGKQIEKVVTTTAQKTTPGGTTPEAVDKTMETTAKTEYPSLFDPAKFAQDWVWSKVNFKDEKSLGAKSLTALAEVRGAVEAFQLIGVTDSDIRNAAKQIAMGKKTIAQYKVDLQQIAKKEYPQFADRFATDPELTTYDIASPVIKLLAKTWEMDEADISVDDPIVSSYMNYAGPDGKGMPPSRADIIGRAKKNSRYEGTVEANENARDAAVGLARAFGFGV
jgi:hypothetical protein